MTSFLWKYSWELLVVVCLHDFHPTPVWHLHICSFRAINLNYTQRAYQRPAVMSHTSGSLENRSLLLNCNMLRHFTLSFFRALYQGDLHVSSTTMPIKALIPISPSIHRYLVVQLSLSALQGFLISSVHIFSSLSICLFLFL